MLNPNIEKGYVSDDSDGERNSKKKGSEKRKSSAKKGAKGIGERPKDDETTSKPNNNNKEIVIDRRAVSATYNRGPSNTISGKGIGQRLRSTLIKSEKNAKMAVRRLARAEMLRTEHDVGYLEADEGEKTHTIRQDDIVREVDTQTAEKRYDLNLPTFGPYVFDYSINGTSLVLLGARGHAACLKWKDFSLESEVQLKERTYDVCYLHDDRLFAAAQKKYTYIYGHDGVEVHQLRNMAEVRKLEFLPQHFLLCGGNVAGVLTWFDVSTGTLVGVQRSRMGEVQSMRRDPTNNVLGVGHTNGTVTFWSPNCSDNLLKIATHRGPVVDMTIDNSGNYLVTVGSDNFTRVWDLRTMGNVQQYSTPLASTVDVSYTGLLAVGRGHRVEVWKDALKTKQQKPYMAHNFDNGLTKTHRLQFCPFEDVLGVGHSTGFSSFLIPGAGCPTPDFFTANVFETKKQRAERPVHQLLDKLPAATIGFGKKLGAASVHDAPRRDLVRRQQEHAKEKQQQRGVSEVDAAGTMEHGTDSESDTGVIDSYEAQQKKAARLANREKDKRTAKRERRMNKMEGTDKYKLKQRTLGRRHARLTRRRNKKDGGGEFDDDATGGSDGEDGHYLSDEDVAGDDNNNSGLAAAGPNAALQRFASRGFIRAKRPMPENSTNSQPEKGK
eukprot:PhM_4_TR15254/c0_g1_i1/m.8471/K14768/UTP7, WDR46; U3 small nucleolar RNA-associated protein 7